jgi:hypothetical protein
MNEIYCQPTFENVDQQNGYSGTITQYTKGVGGAGIAASVLSYVDAVKKLPYPYCRWDRSEQVRYDEGQDGDRGNEQGFLILKYKFNKMLKTLTNLTDGLSTSEC